MGTGASSKVGLPLPAQPKSPLGYSYIPRIQKVWDHQRCLGSGPQPGPHILDLRKRVRPTLHVQSQLLCFHLWGQPGSEGGWGSGVFASCWGEPLATWASSRGAQALGLKTCPEDAETPVTQQRLPSRCPGPPTLLDSLETGFQTWGSWVCFSLFQGEQIHTGTAFNCRGVDQLDIGGGPDRCGGMMAWPGCLPSQPRRCKGILILRGVSGQPSPFEVLKVSRSKSKAHPTHAGHLRGRG